MHPSNLVENKNHKLMMTESVLNYYEAGHTRFNALPETTDLQPAAREKDDEKMTKVLHFLH